MNDVREIDAYIAKQISMGDIRTKNTIMDRNTKELLPRRSAILKLEKMLRGFNSGMDPRWVAILGLRGVGKTTMISQLFQSIECNPAHKVYISLDDAKNVLGANISDINGINTSGNGIGHDLRLIIDENPKTSYTINRYFQADPNSYTTGTVRFKLPKLPDGKHTLTFHAWDLLNNSTTLTADFEVVTGLKPVIMNVTNYPNPVKTETKFLVGHNRPEVILESKLDVYDLSGRHVFSKRYTDVENIKWNLKDNNGGIVQGGVYIYKISIKTTNSEFVSKANKIIVLGQ